jgi:hypothetical protein
MPLNMAFKCLEKCLFVFLKEENITKKANFGHNPVIIDQWRRIFKTVLKLKGSLKKTSLSGPLFIKPTAAQKPACLAFISLFCF